jgi:two-component sensor histidine kinase
MRRICHRRSVTYRPVVFVRLPPRPGSATHARRFASDAAAALPPDVVDIVALLATELATNAILHAGTSFEFAIEVSPDKVTLCVSDDSAVTPTVKHYKPQDVTGRGLALVEALAARWGVDTTPTGKTVWCDIAIPTST